MRAVEDALSSGDQALWDLGYAAGDAEDEGQGEVAVALRKLQADMARLIMQLGQQRKALKGA
jgi:hypothetical protein